MPLRALLDGQPVQAFELDALAWEEVKRSYRERGLRTACCGNPAVPKRSPLGTHFFAHQRRGDCTGAPETREHLLAKSIVASAASAAGRRVTAECQGTTPEGEPWIADVLAERNGVRVALEIQWTPQTIEQYRERQARYKRSGVRTAWFVRRLPKDGYLDASSTHDLPMFVISRPEGEPSFHVPLFALDLHAFVGGLLRGSLRWAPQVGRRYQLSILLHEEACWKCGKPTPIVVGASLHDERLGPVGYATVHSDEHLRWLQPFLTPTVRQQLLLGEVKQRYSRTAGERYLSQGCVHCDALMGGFYVMEMAMEVAYHEPTGFAVGQLLFNEAHEEWFPPEWRWSAVD